MKTNILSLLFLFFLQQCSAQSDLEMAHSMSASIKAFKEKNYEEVIKINEEIIDYLHGVLTADVYGYNKKHVYIFSLGRSHFSKAKAKAYLGKLEEGFDDLNTVENAYPQYRIFKLYKALYKSTFFDNDVQKTLFFENYGKMHHLIDNKIAKELFNFGYYDDALAFFSSSLKQKKSAYNYYDAGRLLEITGNQKKAKQHYKKAWESIYKEGISGFDKHTYLRILLMPKLGKESEVMDALDRAIIEQTHSLPYLKLKAYNQYKNQKYQKAIATYNQILIEDPYAENAFIHLASSHIEIGEKVKGVSILNELIVEKPNYYRALCERAKYNIRSNNFELAEKDLKKALKLKSNHPLGLKLTGDLQLALNIPKQACFYYKLAQEKYYLGVYDDPDFSNNINLACPK